MDAMSRKEFQKTLRILNNIAFERDLNNNKQSYEKDFNKNYFGSNNSENEEDVIMNNEQKYKTYSINNDSNSIKNIDNSFFEYNDRNKNYNDFVNDMFEGILENNKTNQQRYISLDREEDINIYNNFFSGNNNISDCNMNSRKMSFEENNIMNNSLFYK